MHSLFSSLLSGAFTTLMNQNAIADGATNMQGTSSSQITTVNDVPSGGGGSDDSSGLSGGAIAGIAIAVVVSV